MPSSAPHLREAVLCRGCQHQCHMGSCCTAASGQGAQQPALSITSETPLHAHKCLCPATSSRGGEGRYYLCSVWHPSCPTSSWPVTPLQGSAEEGVSRHLMVTAPWQHLPASQGWTRAAPKAWGCWCSGCSATSIPLRLPCPCSPAWELVIMALPYWERLF